MDFLVTNAIKGKRIEVGKVYRNKSSGYYIHIKEVTKLYYGDEPDFNVVAGDECEFKGDSKTNRIRQVIHANKFWEIYKEEGIEEQDGSEENKEKIKKALKFVEQFVEHLENHPEVRNAPVNAGIPMCKICDKTIDEIYEVKPTK